MRTYVHHLVCPWLLALVCTAAAGCQTKRTSDRDLRFVDPAEAEVLVQGRSRLLGLAGRTAGVWVDPRRESDFVAAHIPGAVHLPLEKVDEDRSKIEGYEIIIVYGNDFNSPDALAMSKELIARRYRNVRTLRGGLRAWRAAGNPVEGEDSE